MCPSARFSPARRFFGARRPDRRRRTDGAAGRGRACAGGLCRGARRAPKPRPRAAVTPVAPKLPSEETIVGRVLYQDGEARGSIELQRRGGALEVARLSLVGDRLTRSGETCRIEVSEPLRLTPRQTISGLQRYEVEFPACPSASTRSTARFFGQLRRQSLRAEAGRLPRRPQWALGHGGRRVRPQAGRAKC